MKIVMTGGGGHVARAAARLLKTHPRITQIVFADIDVAAATQSAVETGGQARALQIDIRDEAALAGALRGARCVLNFAGPFFEFGPRVLRAAISAKVDYLDVCDDWEPTLEMLDMSSAAADAGVTAVLGMGSSPGVSNLLAKTAMGRLTQVQNVYTVWSAGEPDRWFVEAHTDYRQAGRASAALVHGVIQMTGKVRAFQGGAVADVTPLTRVTIDVPELGPVEGAVFGHPEPITLPRQHRVSGEVLCLMMLPRSWIPLHERYILPLNALQNINYQAAADAYLAGVAALVGSGQVAVDRRFAGVPRSFAYADGWMGGEAKAVVAYLNGRPPGGMPEATATPLAVAVSFLLEGQLSRPGVWAPEDCIDQPDFFRRFARHCVMRDGVGPGAELVQVSERTS